MAVLKTLLPSLVIHPASVSQYYLDLHAEHCIINQPVIIEH